MIPKEKKQFRRDFNKKIRTMLWKMLPDKLKQLIPYSIIELKTYPVTDEINSTTRRYVYENIPDIILSIEVDDYSRGICCYIKSVVHDYTFCVVDVLFYNNGEFDSFGSRVHKFNMREIKFDDILNELLARRGLNKDIHGLFDL
jgi:hypothetical protein